MKVVVTGATGFIGKPLLRHLASVYKCYALVRDVSSINDVPCEHIHWTADEGSDFKASSVLDALRNASAVVHLAGYPIATKRWNQSIKDKILSSRVEGTRKVVQAIATLPESERPKLFISGSAIGFYGDRGDERLNEDCSAGSGFLCDVVKAWEKEALAAEALGLQVVRIRLGVVLGKGGGALMKMRPVVLGSGRQWMSWIHIEDVVRFIEFAISNHKLSGAFNLTAPNPVTNEDFTKHYARTTGATSVFKVPTFLLRAAMGDMAQIVLDSCRAFPERAERAGFTFKYSNLDLALSSIYSRSSDRLW